MCWDDGTPCFGSLSYCCMRANGCPRRDASLLTKYPDLAEDGCGEMKVGPKIMAKYFAAKRQLAKHLLLGAKNQGKTQFWLNWDK